MSILLHKEIIDNYNDGLIHIDPFNEDSVAPNSYDVRLSNKLKIYISKNPYEPLVLDCKKKHTTLTLTIPEEGFILEPGVLYLGSTIEEIGSDHFIPMFEGVSSLARLGLMTHLSSSFGSIGFKKNWTTEMQAVYPIKIYPGIKIGQVYFNRINSEENLAENRYKGKYYEQDGPRESMSHLNF